MTETLLRLVDFMCGVLVGMAVCYLIVLRTEK